MIAFIHDLVFLVQTIVTKTKVGDFIIVYQSGA